MKDKGTSIFAVAMAMTLSAAVISQVSAQTLPSPPITLEKLAADAGVSTCLGAVHRFAPAFTGPDGNFATVLMTNTSAPDAAMFSASVESRDSSGSHLVSAFVAPTTRGGCDVSYDRVDVWSKSCQLVAMQDLGYDRPLQVIGSSVAVVPFSSTHHVYLMQTAGNGCVSIAKEILFPQ